MSRLKNIAITICFSLVISALSASPALAKKADRTDELKNMMTTLLDNQKQAMAMQGIDMEQDGALLVEPNGKFYAVTLPHISFTGPEGGKTDLGMIAMNAMPGDIPEQWKITMAIPMPLAFYAADGSKAAELNIGNQYFAGIWDTRLNNFLNINAKYSQIRFAPVGKPVSITIPELTLSSLFKESGDNLMSGPFNMTARDFDIKSPEVNGHIGKLSMDMDIANFSLDSFAAYNENIKALTESMEAGDPESDSGPHALAMYNLVFDFMSNAWDGFTSSISAENIAFSSPVATDKPARTFELAKAGYHYDMTGFRDDRVSLRIAAYYQGMKLNPAPADMKGMEPNDFKLDISLNNLPYKELVDLGRNALKMSIEAPSMGKMAGLQAIALAPQILTQAKTDLTIANSHVAGQGYRITADGKAVTDMQAPHGATGKARVAVEGMDNILSTLKEAKNDPALSAENKKKLSDTTAGLTVIQMIGQQEQSPRGTPVRSYNFELTDQGALLLNNTDLSVVMKMMKEK